MTSGEPLSDEDQARQSRSLNITVTNLEKVTEAACALEKAAEKAHGADRGDKRLKAEQLRREIAERLERLNAQWNAQSKPEVSQL